MKEFNDEELHKLLQTWEAPTTPSSLREDIWQQYRNRRKWNWRWLFTGTLRMPVPVAALVALILTCLAIAAFMPRTVPPPPPPQVVTRVIEVPVIQERVVTRTVYRVRTVPGLTSSINLKEFQPVSSLMPHITRSGQNVNQN